MFLGIDIGSSSSKAALIDGGGRLLGAQVVNLGTGTKGIAAAEERLFAELGLSRAAVQYTVATGYGRLLYPGADRQVTEITCHARGIGYLMQGARTVIDIGGQDSKVIRLDGAGHVQNFMMNEKCAAGTGRFLEVIARVLGCPVEELSDFAAQAEHEVPISSVCTVFAESEVISQLSKGAQPSDVARGALRSVAKRVAGLAGRVGIEGAVAMSGGAALNRSMVAVLAEELNVPVTAAPHCQAVGAVGAAVLARESLLKRQTGDNKMERA